MTSLNEALTNLGELIAENLTTQGVPSTYDEGLTTLAGKILDIQGGGSTYDGITISANTVVEKDNTLTLTSQLTLNGIPVTVPNISIDWYEDGTLFDTILTDNNGQTTYTYSATGTGDIPIKAQTDNLTDTVTIEDCLIYDSLTSSSGKWTIPTGVTSVYDTTGWSISANAYKQIKLTEKLTSDCSVEFTIVDYGSSNMTTAPPVIVYQYTGGETTPNQQILQISGNSSFIAAGTTINHAMIKGAAYRIEYTSSTISVYENNVLLASTSNTVGFPTRFEFHMGANSRYAVYKNLKVKPL